MIAAVGLLDLDAIETELGDQVLSQFAARARKVGSFRVVRGQRPAHPHKRADCQDNENEHQENGKDHCGPTRNDAVIMHAGTSQVAPDGFFGLRAGPRLASVPSFWLIARLG